MSFSQPFVCLQKCRLCLSDLGSLVFNLSLNLGHLAVVIITIIIVFEVDGLCLLHWPDEVVGGKIGRQENFFVFKASVRRLDLKIYVVFIAVSLELDLGIRFVPRTTSLLLVDLTGETQVHRGIHLEFRYRFCTENSPTCT